MVAMTSVERLRQYIEYGEQEPEWESADEDSHLASSWPTKGKIEIKNLKVRYRPGLPLVLKGIDIDILPRQKVGILGRTGSGKSTLMLVLARILEIEREEKSTESPINQNSSLLSLREHDRFDEEGSWIKIDGVNISKLGLHTARRAVTIVPQDPFLLEGTLRSNLDPLDGFKTAELIQSLQKVEFFSTIKNEIMENLKKSLGLRPNAVLTDSQRLQLPIEKAGSNLSLGQRQLICIARALVNTPKILLMDEATASIDQKTDQIIQRVILNEMNETTILTIAHRIDTIIKYDKLVVLDNGRKAEEGSPGELLEDEFGLFSGMVDDCGEEFRAQMIRALD